MQFELTEALLDDILFSMEDQEGDFLLDTMEGVVTGGKDGPELSDEGLNDVKDSIRYIPLPEWDSSSGFRLMERFVAGMRNHLVREQLGLSLSQGRGVFRAFKNTLARYPEAEKLWFQFKEKEMKREIIKWYNGLREEWGLKEIGLEPEETDDLVLEDFIFRPIQNENISKVEELHCQCLEEFTKTLSESGFSGKGISAAGIVKEATTAETIASDDPSSLFKKAMIAESSGGELAGYISGEKNETVLIIKRLEVKSEFRGLGIGETLLVKFLESLDPAEISEVLLDLPSWAEGFSRVIRRESFKPYMVKYWLSLRDWAE